MQLLQGQLHYFVTFLEIGPLKYIGKKVACKDNFLIWNEAQTQLKSRIKMFILNYEYRATFLYITEKDFFSLTKTTGLIFAQMECLKKTRLTLIVSTVG